MPRKLLISALLVTLVAISSSCQGVETATESIDDGAEDEFVHYPQIDSPVFEALSTDPFIFDPPLPEGRQIFRAGTLAYDGEAYYLFFNLYSEAEGPNAVYLAISEDGLNWLPQEDPVVQAAPGSGRFFIASDILEDDEGTWHVYLSANLTGPAYAQEFSIWQATSPSLEGPWVLGDAPLLERGAPDSWDQGSVLLPLVVKTDFGYLMYYHGASSDEGNLETSIGMAVSVDGVDWVRGIPGGAVSPYPEFENVIASRFDSDWGDVLAREVWRTNAGWQMIYIQYFGQTQFPQLRMATSPDGVDWEPMDEVVSFTLAGLEYFPGVVDVILLPRQDGYDMVIGTFQSFTELNFFMTQLRVEE